MVPQSLYKIFNTIYKLKFRYKKKFLIFKRKKNFHIKK